MKLEQQFLKSEQERKVAERELKKAEKESELRQARIQELEEQLIIK